MIYYYVGLEFKAEGQETLTVRYTYLSWAAPPDDVVRLPWLAVCGCVAYAAGRVIACICRPVAY